MACTFCQIVARQMPAEILFQDERATAFRDLHPVAPTHILIVPNKHISSVNSLEAGDEDLIGHLFSVAKQIAAQAGIDQGGYRLIINTGPDAGQTIFHLHVHLIGGRRMRFLTG